MSKDNSDSNNRTLEAPNLAGFKIVGKISQIAFVYPDIVEAAKRYVRLFSLHPWHFYTFAPPDFRVSNTTVRGIKTDFSMKLAFAWEGHWMVELIQPLDENSIYAEFLRECNGKGGIHHVGTFEVPDLSEAVEQMGKLGIPTLQTGIFSRGEFTTNFAYMDTLDTFGTIIELIHKTGDRPAPDFVLP